MDVADLVRPRRVKAMTGLIGSMAYALLLVSPSSSMCEYQVPIEETAIWR